MSSDTNELPDPVERFHEGNLHATHHGELSRDNADWLATRDHGVDSLVRMERLRHENADAYLGLTAAMQDDKLRPVLIGLCQEGGTATYDDLENYTTVSRRTLKDRVYDLADDGVLAIDDTRPAVIHYPNDAVDALAKDVVSLYYTT